MPFVISRQQNSGDDVGTLHRPVLMALEEEATDDGMASTSSLSSTQSPLKAIASVVFSSSSPAAAQPHVNGSMSTPKAVKKDIYRGVCQLDDAGRNGQRTDTPETVRRWNNTYNNILALLLLYCTLRLMNGKVLFRRDARMHFCAMGNDDLRPGSRAGHGNRILTCIMLHVQED